MPVSFADLMAESASVTFETSLGPIEVRYRPYAMTLEREAEINRLTLRIAAAGRAVDAGNPTPEDIQTLQEAEWAMAEMFCDVATWIDICGPMYGSDGEEIVAANEMLPVKPEYIVKLSSRVYSRALNAIQQNLQEEEERYAKPSKNDKKPSNHGSRRGSFGP